MPQAIPYIISWAADAAETALSIAAGDLTAVPALINIATTIGSIATTIAVTEVASALLAPKTPTAEAQRQTLRQTLPPRYRGCGHTRMGGAFLLEYASGQNLDQVVAFLDCVGSNVDRYWLNQDRVTLTGNQVNTLANGAYSRVKLYTTFGQPGVGAFPELTAMYPGVWPATSSGNAVFMGHLSASNGKIEQFVKDFPRGPQIQFNLACDVDLHFDWRDPSQSRFNPSTWHNSSNPVVALVNELYRFRGYSWDLDFAPTLSILSAEADVCDQPIDILNILAEVALDAQAGDHTIRLVSIDGLSATMTIIIAGSNYTVSGFGTVHPDGFDVDLSGGLSGSVAAGSTVRWVSDPASPPTRPRYTADGRWAAGEPEADSVDRLLKSMDGFMFRRGSDGAVVIRSGHYVAPTYTIGLDEIVDYDWPAFVDQGKIVNQLVPAYVEPANDYNQLDSTPWDDTDSIDRDGLNSDAFAPALVQSNSQVRRLAKARTPRNVTPTRSIVLKASGLNRLGERFLQLPAAGIEIDEMNGAILEVVDAVEIIDNGMHVRFPVKLFEPACYDWDYLTEEGDGPVDVAAPATVALSPPVITSATPVFSTVMAGVAGVRISADATGPSRDDLTWSVRTRETGTTSWDETTDRSLTGGAVTILSDIVTGEALVDVEVGFQVAGGLPVWSATFVVTTATDATAPDDLVSITVDSWGNSLNLRTQASARARDYVWRFFKSDGVTLVDTVVTDTPIIRYSATMAALSPGGVQRAYVVACQPQNSAGMGAGATTGASKPALAAVTGVTPGPSGSVGQIAFTTNPDAVGYLVPYADLTGFNPASYGASVTTGASPASLYGLAAGTYFALVAAYDEWTANPALLNFSSQVAFTITGASPTPAPPGGGVGGGAGGLGGGGEAINLF